MKRFISALFALRSVEAAAPGSELDGIAPVKVACLFVESLVAARNGVGLACSRGAE